MSNSSIIRRSIVRGTSLKAEVSSKVPIDSQGNEITNFNKWLYHYQLAPRNPRQHCFGDMCANTIHYYYSGLCLMMKKENKRIKSEVLRKMDLGRNHYLNNLLGVDWRKICVFVGVNIGIFRLIG